MTETQPGEHHKWRYSKIGRSSTSRTRSGRHESKAPLGGVLMSASVYDRVAAHVEAEEMTGLTFKGIDTPQSAWVLKALRD